MPGVAGAKTADGMDACRMLSGRGVCVGLITCLGDVYRVCVCLNVCDLDTSKRDALDPCCATE